MGVTEVRTPVASSDGKNTELGDDDGGADGSRDFLGGLDPKANVTLGVTDDNNSLEASALAGTGLLLDGFDLVSSASHSSIAPESSVTTNLHNLVLQFGQKEVHNLVLLDGQGVQVDLLHAGDLSGLDETAELGDRLPFLLLPRAATATATAATTTVTAARAKSSTSTGSVSHDCMRERVLVVVVVELAGGSEDIHKLVG